MKPNHFIAILSCLIISTNIQAQVITDKPAFIKNLMQVFYHRDSGFDSLVLQGVKEVGSPASKLKLPRVDETYIYNKTYHAGFAFKDKAQAEAFIKEVKGLITEAAIAYNAKARFVPNPDTPQLLQFHIGNSEGFYTQPDEIELFDRSYQKIERPFVVYLRFNGKGPTFSYYVTAGKRIVNTEISNLIKDAVLGKDSLMVQLKGKKIPGKIISYESKRTLKGYKATVYQHNDYNGIQNILQLIKNWTGKKDEEVFMKADTLMQNLKAALPVTYCYLMDTKEQKVIFYPQPFSNIITNARLEIGYGRNADGKNAYYVLLNLYRFVQPEDLETVATPTIAVKTTPKLYPFKGDNGKYGYKNDKNEIVVQPRYDEAASFNEERGRIILNGRHGYVDINGKELFAPKYDYAGLFFTRGTSKVKLYGKYGIINKDGKELVAPKYDDMDEGMLRTSDASQNKFIMVKLNNKYGFIDSTGREVLPLKYDKAYIVASFRAVVALEGKVGLIDQTGKPLVPFMYDDIYFDIPTKTLRPRLGNKRGLMNSDGKLLVPVIYHIVNAFSEDFAAVQDENKHGFVDKTGKLAIPLIYEGASNFSEGLASVRQNGKWGYINKTGKLVIPCQYNYAMNFKYGKAEVKKDDREFYIDKTGKEIKQ